MLHPCLDCGAQISSDSVSCPDCGRPVPAYAGFWIRVGAQIIDAVIGWIPLFILLLVAPYDEFLNFLLGYMALMVYVLFFLSYLESSPKQSTWGKRVVGLKVTDLHGGRISYGRALGRQLGKQLSNLLMCIGFIMVGITERKQGLHDKIASTLVVKS